MNLVWNSTLDGPSKRFVLLALADRASDEGECTSLGVTRLCRKTGISRAQVFRLLQDLEQADDLIKREEQTRSNGSRKASRFWINLPLLAEMQQADDDQDADEPTNPFDVSAVQPAVSPRDGGLWTTLQPPSHHETGPVSPRDPQGVSPRDGGSLAMRPLDPITSSDTDSERADGRSSRSPEASTVREAEAARLVGSLDLSKCGPSPKQLGQIRSAVVDALARGVPAETVAEHARRKSLEAETVKYFVRAFSAEYLPDDAIFMPARDSPLPPCGQCDARPGDPLSGRVVWLDAAQTQSRWCPRCHPKGLATSTQAS